MFGRQAKILSPRNVRKLLLVAGRGRFPERDRLIVLIATRQRIFAAVQAFDAFDAGNDPWHEHDFGAVEVDGQRVFFKLEYYDLTRAMHSEDPADPTKTERVMTIMLADEY